MQALHARLLHDLRSADASSSHKHRARSNTTYAALPVCASEYTMLGVLWMLLINDADSLLA